MIVDDPVLHPHASYAALREEATWLAGAPGDIARRVALDHSLYRDSLGNHAFPLVALHGALIDRPDEPVLGAGEPAICPIGAAINNAIFDAIGVWLRQASYTPERVLAALQGA